MIKNKIKKLKQKYMPTYDKDNNLIFDPEQENDQELFPQQTKVLRPKKYKTKMTVKRKGNIKRKLIKLAIVLVIIISAITYGTYRVSKWFETHTIKWQSPIQTPVWIEQREQSAPRHDAIKEAEAKEIDFTGATFIQKQDEKPAPADQVLPISEIVAKVYRLESSATNSAGCQAKGLYNGYGYIPGSCYKSHAEVQQLVTNWFTKKLKTYDLATALCGYNLGFASKHLEECKAQSASYPYYRDFLNL